MNEYNIYTPDPSVTTPMPTRKKIKKTKQNTLYFDDDIEDDDGDDNEDDDEDHFVEQTKHGTNPQNIVYNTGLSGCTWDPWRMICQNVMSSCFWCIFFPGTPYNASILSDEMQMRPTINNIQPAKDLLVIYTYIYITLIIICIYIYIFVNSLAYRNYLMYAG